MFPIKLIYNNIDLYFCVYDNLCVYYSQYKMLDIIVYNFDGLSSFTYTSFKVASTTTYFSLPKLHLLLPHALYSFNTYITYAYIYVIYLLSPLYCCSLVIHTINSQNFFCIVILQLNLYFVSEKKKKKTLLAHNSPPYKATHHSFLLHTLIWLGCLLLGFVMRSSSLNSHEPLNTRMRSSLNFPVCVYNQYVYELAAIVATTNQRLPFIIPLYPTAVSTLI